MKNLNRNGAILVISLWILAILAILAIGIGYRISIEGRLAKYNMDRLKALYLAKAGIVKAQEVLRKDTDTYDWLYQCGVTLNRNKEETPESIFKDIKLGEGAFSVGYTDGANYYAGMSDEERKININTVGVTGTSQTVMPPEALETLLKPYADNKEKEIVAAILAWRKPKQKDTDMDIDDKYGLLGYERKGGDFSVVEELLLVDGITPKIYDSIKDYVTVYGNKEGKVNINTAPQKVLAAIFSRSKIPNPGQAADDVVSARNAPKGSPWSYDAQCITETNIDSVLTNAGFDPADKENLKNYFTMQSNYFRIESEGMVTGSQVKKKIAAVVKKPSGTGSTGAGEENKLLYYREY